MAVTVEVIDLVADATDGPFVLVTEVSATAPQSFAVVRVLDAKATIGAGTLARVRLLDVRAVTEAAGYEPATLGAANGSGQWIPYRTRTSDGSGSWS